MKRIQSWAVESRLRGKRSRHVLNEEGENGRGGPGSAGGAARATQHHGEIRAGAEGRAAPSGRPSIFRISLLSTLSFLGIEAARGAHEPHWDLVTCPPLWTGSLAENRYRIPSFVTLSRGRKAGLCQAVGTSPDCPLWLGTATDKAEGQIQPHPR